MSNNMIELSVILFLLMLLISAFYRWTMQALLKQNLYISDLEVRVTELEFKNASLHQKLVTLEIATARTIHQHTKGEQRPIIPM